MSVKSMISRDWIGRAEVAEDILSASLAQKFHETLELPGKPAQYGEIAPRLIHFCLCHAVAATSSLDEDGHIARGGFFPPISLPRRMWAASELSFHGDLHVGDTIRRSSNISDVEWKTGKSGELCFVTIDHKIYANDILRIEERQTIVYREAQPPSSTGLVSSPPHDIANVSRRVGASTSLLFRYSALTFNSHRIHYDQPYAVEQEGYRGLVVHGPLQATWLFHFAAETNPSPLPTSFRFKAVSALFSDDDISLSASQRNGNRQNLWTARGDGSAAVHAEILWS